MNILLGLNLWCLYPAMCVKSGDGSIFPSTQRHYRRLILLLILLYCYIFRSYGHLQVGNILLARITELTTDPLFYKIANIIVIVFYN
jgi:hypothetical protein